MDGQLLARARARKEEIRRNSLAEDIRRRELACGRVPALRTWSAGWRSWWRRW